MEEDDIEIECIFVGIPSKAATGSTNAVKRDKPSEIIWPASAKRVKIDIKKDEEELKHELVPKQEKMEKDMKVITNISTETAYRNKLTITKTSVFLHWPI